MFHHVPVCSGMFRNVLECSGMFRVPDFINAQITMLSLFWKSAVEFTFSFLSLLVYSHASNALYYRLCKNDGGVLSIVVVSAVKRNLRSRRDSRFEACYLPFFSTLF